MNKLNFTSLAKFRFSLIRFSSFKRIRQAIYSSISLGVPALHIQLTIKPTDTKTQTADH